LVQSIFHKFVKIFTHLCEKFLQKRVKLEKIRLVGYVPGHRTARLHTLNLNSEEKKCLTHFPLFQHTCPSAGLIIPTAAISLSKTDQQETYCGAYLNQVAGNKQSGDIEGNKQHTSTESFQMGTRTKEKHCSIENITQEN
jgi:hypothetical protein